jgi:TolB-like protein/DNA-binding winged helix-turn-helix (wHTH) protein
MGRTGPKRLQIPWRNLAELARDLRRTYSIAMIYQFGPFELDLATVELRGKGEARSLEPQVFALLALLVENHARLVSKDEIIEKVWDGRIVSDAAVASRVKSARQALGDDGQSQRFIKTIHGQGFRFVAEVRALRGSPVHLTAGTGDAHATQDVGVLVRQLERVSRPSLAVLPFRTVGDPVRCEAIANALPAELITELSRLRWLFVTARGSSFRMRATDSEFSDIGRLLGVRYCLRGTVEVSDRRLVVTVELVDTLDEGIVWADRFSGRIDDVHSMREEIRSRVLVTLDIQIPMHEAALARLSVPDDLDAWSAYHLGLQHIYRFNGADNAAAARLFQRAVTLDARFARAHAGLSFVHFQTAFMRYTDDIAGEIRQARHCAERGLELDPLDPFVNFTMGRSYWLEGNLESSLSWLERATSVSPNYAQGIYARAWTEALAGRASEGRKHVDLAMRLSPIDPLYYAMMATRAFTHMVMGEDAEAADWAERGARSPGAHVLIAMIAAAAQSLNGDASRAAWWAANVRERNAALSRDDFFRAFPMRSDPMRTRVLQALTRLGF